MRKRGALHQQMQLGPVTGHMPAGGQFDECDGLEGPVGLPDLRHQAGQRPGEKLARATALVRSNACSPGGAARQSGNGSRQVRVIKYWGARPCCAVQFSTARQVAAPPGRWS
ncbi:MAG TPA: hypothetical protein VGK74_06275 [Symbiobacteriaceae bacterium]